MNITQIMNIFDWKINHKISDTLIREIFPDATKYMIGLNLGNVNNEFNVVFNNLTSEVAHIEYGNHRGYIKYWTDNKQLANGNTKQKNGYCNSPSSLDFMLDLMNKKMNKEPDELLPIDMDTDVLARVDEEAAKLDISRNSFLTKVVLDFIRKGNDETILHT